MVKHIRKQQKGGGRHGQEDGQERKDQQEEIEAPVFMGVFLPSPESSTPAFSPLHAALLEAEMQTHLYRNKIPLMIG